MVIGSNTHFMNPECVVCRKSLGKSRVWKQREGSLCRRCKRDLETLASASPGQTTGRDKFPFRFSLFEKFEDLKRAEEIWNKPISELTRAELDWGDAVMKRILSQQSPRGRKADADYERIERLLIRLALRGKPRPSYGQIAELVLSPGIEKSYQRDRIVQALKRRRRADQLPSPPLPG
jgi:hypothetical protein